MAMNAKESGIREDCLYLAQGFPFGPEPFSGEGPHNLVFHFKEGGLRKIQKDDAGASDDGVARAKSCAFIL